jgi:hypothetical protein
MEKHPLSSLRGWSHPNLRGYSSMSLEYPKLTTWTKVNLGKFLIPLLYEGLFLLYEGFFSLSFSTKVSFFSTKVSSLFLLYEGLPVGFLIPSLRRSLPFSTKVSSLFYEGLAMGSEKNLLWSKIFTWYNTMLPICWAPSIYWITFILIKISHYSPTE